MRKSSLMLMVVLSTLSSLGVGLLGPIYPIFLVNRFSASILDLGLLYAVILLVAAFFKAAAGSLVDLYGKEKVFFFGVMIGAACSLSYIFASNLLHLYVIEFFFAISYAFQRPALLSFIMDISDKNRRGLFLGAFESVYDIAEAAAAVASSIIVSQVGFEPLFFLSSGCQATTGFFVLKTANKT